LNALNLRNLVIVADINRTLYSSELVVIDIYLNHKMKYKIVHLSRMKSITIKLLNKFILGEI